MNISRQVHAEAFILNSFIDTDILKEEVYKIK